MKISSLGEFGLIGRIRKNIMSSSDVLTGIGDDAAVTKSPGRNNVLLLTVDNVVQGIHFLKGTHPKSIGRKALARSLSDIAAMGGIPKYAMITLGLPKNFSVKMIDLLYEGFHELAETYKVDIVGGDITRSFGTLFISVSIVGYAKKNRYFLRNGAKKGDYIFVTGKLGGSISGKHLSFKPRVFESQWLLNKKIPNAMIDVSDGLVGDLRHLLEESRVGACLYKNKIPISSAAHRLADKGGTSALERALWDGEDYELLFSSGKKDVSWTRLFKSRFGVDVTCIGEVISEPLRIYLKDEKEKTKEIKQKGFAHF